MSRATLCRAALLGMALCFLMGCTPLDPTGGNNNNNNNNGDPEPTILSGVVTRSGGTSATVDGAVVQITPVGTAVAADATSATTRDGGRFAFEDAPEGTFDLVVTPPSAEPLRGETVTVSTIAETTSSVVVRLVSKSVTVTSITINPGDMTVGLGKSQQFSATVVSSSAETLQPTWSTTGSIGTITSTGLFTAAAAGSGQVRATLGGVVASVDIEVPDCVLEVRDEEDQSPLGGLFRAASRLESGAGPVEVIISLSDQPAGRDLIARCGGTITKDLELIGGVVATVPASAVSTIENDKSVRYVSLNSRVSIRDQDTPWGIDQIDAERAWGGSENASHVTATGVTGKGVKVAIIDTGIDSTHPDLAVAGGVNILNPDAASPAWQDDNGHGTRVAGIIGARDNNLGVVGVAPECDLYAVKVLDLSGSGSVADVVEGIEWCIDNGMQVINMSLGVTTYESVLKDACDRAYDDGQGAIVVGAAGNAGQDLYTAWPGNFASVISVAGTDTGDNRCSFSMQGAAVELAAPGDEVLTTDLGGTYAEEDGTSFSAPHVAGAAALVFSTGRYSSAERVRQHLRDTAVDLGVLGRDHAFGYGRIDCHTAVTDESCSDQAGS